MSEVLTFRRSTVGAVTSMDCDNCKATIWRFAGHEQFKSPSRAAERHASEHHKMGGILETKFDAPDGKGFELMLIREQPWGNTLRGVVEKIQATLMSAGVPRDLWTRIHTTYSAESHADWSPEMVRLLGRNILRAAASINPRAAQLVTDMRLEQYVLSRVQFSIHEMERHEADEFLTFSGKRLRDPHANDAETRVLVL